jgi:outer membrane receptor for ferrienterochelin and colicins
VVGIENNGAWLKDKKLGYFDIDNAILAENSIADVPHTENVVVADQATNTLGVFAQYEINWDKLILSAGARFDNYKASLI